MRKQETKSQIKKGEKYGVYNISDNYLESHHRSLNSANNQCRRRQNLWAKERLFEVVEIVK